jgi:hypothetical protein
MQSVWQSAAVGLGAIALTVKRVVRGAPDADGRHHRSHLVALVVSMADGAAQGAHSAFNQVKNRRLSAVLSAVIAILGNFETGVALHGHCAAVAKLEPRFTASGLHHIAIKHGAVRKEGLSGASGAHHFGLTGHACHPRHFRGFSRQCRNGREAQ